MGNETLTNIKSGTLIIKYSQYSPIILGEVIYQLNLSYDKCAYYLIVNYCWKGHVICKVGNESNQLKIILRQDSTINCRAKLISQMNII